MSSEYNPSGEIPSFESVLPTLSETTETIVAFFPSVTANTTYPIALNIPFGGWISGLVIQTSSGTIASSVVTIGGTGVTMGLGSASSTESTYTATALNSFSAGQDLKIIFGSVSSPVNVSVNLLIVRSIPSTDTSIVTSATGVVLDGSKEENIVYPLTQNVTLYTISFAKTKTDSNGVATTSYSVLQESPVENTVDDASLLISARVVGKTSTGITILLSANPDTANYVYRANVKVI